MLQFDLPARKAEREERLLAMNGGRVNATLFSICWEGGGKDARFLLAHGADANNRRGWSVIESAAHYGHLPVVEALLDAGAGARGEALLVAAYRGNTAVVALLLDRGVDVHYLNDSALYNTAVMGQLETATLLLQRGATATRGTLDTATLHGRHAVADLLRAHVAV